MTKALTTTVVTIDRSPGGPFRPDSDMADMKALPDGMFGSNAELAHHTPTVHIALTGNAVRTAEGRERRATPVYRVS